VQHLIFEVDGKTGLTSAIAGETKLPDAIRPTRVPGLHVLPCGPLPTQPSELLAGKRFKRMMQVLSKTFDRIIIDAPPLMRFTDGTILAASADVTLLVLRLNQSMRPLSEAALERLGQVGARVLGAVANGGTADVSPYYGRSWNYSLPSQGGQLVGADWTSSDRQVASRPAATVASAEPEQEDQEANGDFDVDVDQLVALHARGAVEHGEGGPEVVLADGDWLRESPR
jgi:capsular exopolysaccharide synthesis family protein